MGGDIEVDPPTNEEFKVPKKTLKRKISEGDRMETESVGSSGVESSASDLLSKVTKPAFPPIKREKLADGTEVRKIPVPSHRYSPLKENWMKIFEPIVQHLKLQIRFNLKTRNVEIRTCKETEDVTSYRRLLTLSKLLSMVSRSRMLLPSFVSMTSLLTASRFRMS